MTFIDWSDAEGMFDLLIEFIRDEMSTSLGDAGRQQFLRGLIVKVSAAKEDSATNAIKQLRAIQESIDEEFRADPAFLHITDFIEELQRIS